MVRIAPVDLPFNPKTLWFDAGEVEISAGDDVVVETARGLEFGHVCDEVFEATPEQTKKLKSQLKPVVRVADDEDREKRAALEEKAAEAMPVFKELAAKTSEEMRPVSVEYLFDGEKAVFYFESENRVDFRELVRSLSSRLHVRVDMRQIGVRDEARMVGGLGHCGQELCCKRLGGEFCPVSIRMAKEQDLSLNPQKISGVCGRLMCCLRYEYEAYKDFKGRAPKKNATVSTPDGPAKVVDLDVPREVVSVRLEGEKPVRVPLSDFDAPEEGNRPKCIGCDAWERACAPEENLFGAAAATLATPQLSGSDKLADRSAVRHVPGGKKRSQASDEEGRGQKRSRGKGRGKGEGRSDRGDGRNERNESAARKPRRRRSTKLSAAGAESVEVREGAVEATGSAQASQDAPASRKPRRSKGDSRRGRDGERGPRQQGSSRQQGGSQKNREGGEGKPEKRKRDRDRDRSANRGLDQGSKQRQPRKQADGSPRPGQKSSGLSRQDAAGGAQAGGEGAGRGHRRTRKRSHKAAGSQDGAGEAGSNQQ